MADWLEFLNRVVWGISALILILGVGIFLSVWTDFAPFRLFSRACRLFAAQLRPRKRQSGGVSPFRALCTALAATVGTGNLAGVAGAMALGGPGTVFWMWCCALVGMVTKYAEATLAVRYRVRQGSEFVSGPMYLISRGMGPKWQWLAKVYCFLGVVAAFGVGNATQINAVIGGMNQALSVFGRAESAAGNLLMGAGLSVLVFFLLRGGSGRIGAAAELLVPFASCAYLLFGSLVLIGRADRIPGALARIVTGAFCPRAVTGGVLASAWQALRIGVSRGVFTNEAGMGTAAIAHGSAAVRHPAEQGLMGMMEVFLDTVVICTMTALVILCSGVPIPYGTDPGIALTGQAFAAVYGNAASLVLAAALCCFAFATVLGWGYYGGRCAQYLFGPKAWPVFTAVQAAVVLLGACLKTGLIWSLSELFNGLMAIPNLLALAALSPELTRLTRDYLQKKETAG